MMSKAAPISLLIKDVVLQPIIATEHKFREKDQIIIVMGPTGAGKSRFIETLAGDDAMGISKDQLESYTQVITTYELVDIEAWDGPGTDVLKMRREPDDPRVYVFDTPGFSDSQISELEIIQMINEWLKAHDCVKIDDILYLSPITDIRLPGSKRRTIEMLKLLARIDTTQPGAVVVVTTMWDRLWNDRAKLAAEERFEQLRDDIWKELIQAGGVITKFLNTRDSALDIISPSVRMGGSASDDKLFTAYAMDYTGPIQISNFSSHLYQDLLNRVQNARQHIQSLLIDLGDLEAQPNEELKIVLEDELRKTSCLLTKFETQLIDFGDPPVGFERAVPLRQALMAQRLQQAGTSTSSVLKFKRILHRGLRSAAKKFKK